MNSPLISIIVPCYNQAEYLDECLQSVLEQTYQNWECLIVNDGSPDDTEKTAKKWIEKDARFLYLEQCNSGVSSARNLGLKNAQGSFIQFLDGDDKLEKDKLNYQITVLNNNLAIDVVYGASRYFFEEDSDQFYAIHPSGIIPSIDLKYTDINQIDVLLKVNVSAICATLYRKNVLTTIKFLDTVYEDYLFHIQIASKGFKFHFESAENGNCLIRITGNSQMLKHIKDSVNNKIFIEEVRKINMSNNSFFSKFNQEIKSIDDSEIFDKKDKKDFLKRLIYNFCPPILLKALLNFKK